eukprot:TRINITY_DN2222_c1_g1_i1.p1 TRINITY_DN2222_c1_g1~~TRINITY_DN2222_c1_g1_i1.p1  ORF type:complete len:209 (+),score=29.42 TRINITY_DN2222_c1_g1_i1:63-689(+)
MLRATLRLCTIGGPNQGPNQAGPFASAPRRALKSAFQAMDRKKFERQERHRADSQVRKVRAGTLAYDDASPMAREMLDPNDPENPRNRDSILEGLETGVAAQRHRRHMEKIEKQLAYRAPKPHDRTDIWFSPSQRLLDEDHRLLTKQAGAERGCSANEHKRTRRKKADRGGGGGAAESERPWRRPRRSHTGSAKAWHGMHGGSGTAFF